MAEPIVEKKEEQNAAMDVSPPPPPVESVNESTEVSENANQILDNQEAEMPTTEPAEEASPELSFPTPAKKTRRAKCPPGCMRKPKCSSKGGKRSKKSNKTKKGSKKSRKSRKSKK
jgi:hypothetical protein